MSVIAIMRGVSDEASLFTEGDVVSITLVWSSTVVALLWPVDTDTDLGIIS